MAAQSWATTKVNVNIDTTNEKMKHGRDFYFHVYVLAMEQAKHISIMLLPPCVRV